MTGHAPSVCHSCSQGVIWARKPDGSMLPFDRSRDTPSAWALWQDVRGDWYARPLAPGDELRPAEHRHEMHFDTCPEREHVGNGHD